MEPTEEPWEEPWVEPTEEPWEEPDPTEDPWVALPVEEATPSPTPSVTRPPIGSGESIATPRPASTPRPALERPKPSLNEGSSSETEEDLQPNYVTFAHLNVRGNSLATTLFFAGVGCIALGVAGLVLILVLYFHGRRRLREGGFRDGILEEIEEAESRQQPPVPAPAPPTPPRPQGDLPQQASLYTEELPYPGDAYGGQEAYYPPEGYDSEEYPEEDYGPYEEDYPEGESYPEGGLEEDCLEEDYPEEEPYEEEPQPAPEATRQFSTEEILREALRYDEEDEK